MSTPTDFEARLAEAEARQVEDIIHVIRLAVVVSNLRSRITALFCLALAELLVLLALAGAIK